MGFGFGEEGEQECPKESVNFEVVDHFGRKEQHEGYRKRLESPFKITHTLEKESFKIFVKLSSATTILSSRDRLFNTFSYFYSLNCQFAANVGMLILERGNDFLFLT